MAIYKVPQDVEAEDKLLGPFSFKQFIFLLIAAGSIAVAYGLSRVLLPLAIIPLPVIIFFGTLALPLRKDQPMEVYLAAIISFILKPKKRLWRPDGIEAMIEVIAPKNEDQQYGKGYSEEEVQRRLSYLANLVDSRGWSVRGVQEPDSSMREDLYNEAQSIDDLLDDSSTRAQNFDSLLLQKDNLRRQEIMNKMQHQAAPVAEPTPVTPPPTSIPQAEPIIYNHVTPQASTGYTPMAIVQPTTPDEDIKLVVNPYPTMNQSVLQPLSQPMIPPATAMPQSTEQLQPVVQPLAYQQPTNPIPIQRQPTTAVVAPTPELQPTSTPEPVVEKQPEVTIPEPVSPAIIDLANNHADLSVESIQREANRIKLKEESEEVVISLR